MTRRKKRLTRLSPGQPRWARRGRGGPPSPLPLKPSRPAGRVTVQNPLSAPVVPHRRSGALSLAAEVGFETSAAQGHTDDKPLELQRSEHNWRRLSPHPAACEAGGQAPPAAPGPLAPACASGRIAEMPGDPVELAVLAAADLLPRGASVLVACSGGPDSVALAGALARCAPEFAIRLAVGHVDHGLRPESARDAEHVREVARQLGLPFHLHRLESLDVRPLGLEGAARPARKPARTASRPRTRGATRRRPCCCASRAAAARGRWPACGAAAP